MYDHHAISYKNVASKLYRFLPEEIHLAFEDFEALLTKHGYHPTGDMFFAIMSNPFDQLMVAELFFVVEEGQVELPKEENVSFRSYFFVKDMVMTIAFEELEISSQEKFWEVLNYIESEDQVQTTPIFVGYKQTSKGTTFVEMSAGIRGD
ncbi:DUF5085 family protein [Aquibacillus rhizosphaerae]|uniref:DUF5085 family protein n=1 Tax=Aquibacillus rhizosphaerae TaxID=3051431 RepID=A0ABT7L7Y3_9BACI|nr:DUF5085 family protein [Aquibacillus sp. LR5S19]MDL4841962.1 DUF5085 family protein [Aquibacillus sp. LR5S19]